MDFGGVDLRVDVPGLKLLGVDDGHVQRAAHKAGHRNAGALGGEHLGDLLTPEALGQGVAHVLNQVHVHAVIEEHIHPDDIALPNLSVVEEPAFEIVHVLSFLCCPGWTGQKTFDEDFSAYRIVRILFIL